VGDAHTTKHQCAVSGPGCCQPPAWAVGRQTSCILSELGSSHGRTLNISGTLLGCIPATECESLLPLYLLLHCCLQGCTTTPSHLRTWSQGCWVGSTTRWVDLGRLIPSTYYKVDAKCVALIENFYQTHSKCQNAVVPSWGLVLPDDRLCACSTTAWLPM
jgi:hypothetical protein